ncbi:hypothetical protein M8494_35025 [Serratia ureilytica]
MRGGIIANLLRSTIIRSRCTHTIPIIASTRHQRYQPRGHQDIQLGRQGAQGTR